MTHPKTAGLSQGFGGLLSKLPGTGTAEKIDPVEIGNLQELRMAVSVRIQKDCGKDEPVAGPIETAGRQTLLKSAIAQVAPQRGRWPIGSCIKRSRRVSGLEGGRVLPHPNIQVAVTVHIHGGQDHRILEHGSRRQDGGQLHPTSPVATKQLELTPAGGQQIQMAIPIEISDRSRLEMDIIEGDDSVGGPSARRVPAEPAVCSGQNQVFAPIAIPVGHDQRIHHAASPGRRLESSRPALDKPRGPGLLKPLTGFPSGTRPTRHRGGRVIGQTPFHAPLTSGLGTHQVLGTKQVKVHGDLGEHIGPVAGASDRPPFGLNTHPTRCSEGFRPCLSFRSGGQSLRSGDQRLDPNAVHS